MTRLLLALLALLGIVAQAAPAEARLCGRSAEVGLVATASAASYVLAQRSVPAFVRLIPPPASAPQALGMIALVAAPRVAPAVRLRIDRARE